MHEWKEKLGRTRRERIQRIELAAHEYAEGDGDHAPVLAEGGGDRDAEYDLKLVVPEDAAGGRVAVDGGGADAAPEGGGDAA